MSQTPQKSAKRDYAAIAAQYMQDVISGDLPACKWVKAACQRQCDDLAKADWQYSYDARRGARVCAFIELLRHVKGPKAGQRIRLEPWQVFITMVIFSWVDKTTLKRRFRRAYLECPKGSGKSLWSSGIALYMLALDGEQGAEVYSAATTRDQAKIVFAVAQQMARKAPELKQKYGVEVSQHSIHVIETMSWFRPLASKEDSLEGLNPHFVVIDELHAHRTREVFDSLTTAAVKRDQPLIWCITTAGSNREGICYEVRAYLTKILNHSVEDDRVFGIIFTIDDSDSWDDPASWRKANPNWGISVFPEAIAQEAHEALQMASKVPAFKQKHLNVWTNADSSWMDMRKWDSCADPSISESDAFEKIPCFIGVDLATRLDLIAVIRLHWLDSIWQGPWPQGVDEKDKIRPRKRHYWAFGTYWVPEATAEKASNSQYLGWISDGKLQTCPGETNDFDLVEQHVFDLSDQFTITEVAHDEWQAHSVMTHLQERGLTLAAVPMRAQFLSPAMDELEAAVMDGRFHFDGDPLMTWAISNVVAHRDRKGNLFPNKERPENKIDPATALLVALSRAMVAEGESSSSNEVFKWA